MFRKGTFFLGHPLTGFPKRPAAALESSTAKRHKTEVSCSKLGPSSTPSMFEACEMGTAPIDTSTLLCPRKSDRKQLRAKRRDPAGIRSKITWWFERQPTSPATPGTPPIKTTPQDPVKLSTPNSLTNSKKSLKKTPKNKGCRKSRKQATTPTPLFAPEDSSVPAGDGSPALQSRIPFRRSEKSKNPTPATVPDVVKTTASSSSKAAQHASSQYGEQAADRKRNLDG